MKIYFAELNGDINGIDRYCRFAASNDAEAQEIADGYAEDNYSQHDETEDEDGAPRYWAKVELWNDEKHGEYIGDACFEDYWDDTTD